MKEYLIENKAKSLIGGWFIDNKICDKIITEFNDRREHTTYDSLRKYSRLATSRIDSNIEKQYIFYLKNCIAEYKKKYKWCVKSNEPWELTLPINIQLFKPGDAYAMLHIESGGPKKGKLQRHLAFMTYLNDVQDGGQTEFESQNTLVQPQKGLTLIWPATWSHPHRGIPAVSEAKYIITGWCSYYHRS